jgi:hypothetical protein
MEKTEQLNEKQLIKMIKTMDSQKRKDMYNNYMSLEEEGVEPETKKEDKITPEPKQVETKKEEEVSNEFVSINQYNEVNEKLNTVLSQFNELIKDKPFGVKQKVINTKPTTTEQFSVEDVFANLKIKL